MILNLVIEKEKNSVRHVTGWYLLPLASGLVKLSLSSVHMASGPALIETTS